MAAPAVAVALQRLGLGHRAPLHVVAAGAPQVERTELAPPGVHVEEARELLGERGQRCGAAERGPVGVVGAGDGEGVRLGRGQVAAAEVIREPSRLPGEGLR